MNLFLDANVLFSAAYHKTGVCRTFFDLAESRRFKLLTSNYAVEEARRNLALKAPLQLSGFEALLTAVQLAPEPSLERTMRWAEPTLDIKDAPIMAAAIDCIADILVTGDRRDFGHLFNRRIEGVLVLKPADALDMVLGLFP